jgi:predicted Zn-dependent protease
MPQILSESEARALCERILSQMTADGADVALRAEESGNARFAGNGITTSADTVDTVATLTARFGLRRASVSFNALDGPGITDAARRAERLAEIAPEDPEQMPLLGPQAYEPTAAFFESTAGLDPETRAAAVAAVTERAVADGLDATGFIEHAAQSVAIANTKGLFAYHRSTEASFTTTVRTADGNGSGWAGTTHNDWDRLEAPEALAERAADKARRSADAVAIEPGAYTVVLEPTAAANLIGLVAGAMNARTADEGRSFFSKRGGGNKVGERVAGEGVTLLSDLRDPDILERPFTEDGLPVARTVWIENGVLRHLAYSRYWAEQQGVEPVPMAGGLKLEGGEGTAADLVAGVERGLLVTRFWYIRSVDQRTLLYTGLTRDGTFLIENGQVTRSVKNMRFNESPMAMLNNVMAAGTAVRVVASGSGGLGPAVVMPPLVVRDFRFTSLSDAV